MNNTNATTGIDIGFKYGIIGGLGLIAIYLYVYFTHNFSAALLYKPPLPPLWQRISSPCFSIIFCLTMPMQPISN